MATVAATMVSDKEKLDLTQKVPACSKPVRWLQVYELEATVIDLQVDHESWRI